MLQLAVKDQVFLLDLLSLSEILSEDMWIEFAESFFCSPNVLKLGNYRDYFTLSRWCLVYLVIPR